MGLLYGFILLLASIPLGYLLKKITKEEIKPGKKYFRVLWIISLGLAIVFFMLSINDYNLKLSIIFSLLFIANVAFISWK